MSTAVDRKVVFTDEEHAQCAKSIGLVSMPKEFTQVILEQRHNGPSPEPVIVATFPEMTREEFLEWRAKQEKK
jgi:hypothetical protein